MKWAHIGADLRLGRLLPSVTAGVIGGLLTLIWSLSLATLIFTGPLSAHLNQGLGLALLGGLVLNVAAACGSSLPSAIAGAQESMAVIVAVMATSIVGLLACGAPAQVLPTVLAAIALTSLTTGAFLFGLGHFRLGRLIRFIPFPVIGGFLAGSGWLVTIGAVQVLTGIAPGATTLRLLARRDPLAHLAPGVLLALVLLVVVRRVAHFLVMLTLVLGSVALFYATLLLMKTPPGVAEARGWLLGPFTGGSLYHPPGLGDIGHINGPALGAQTGGMVTVMVVAAVGLLLNVTGLAVGTGRDLDVDRELRTMGIANVLAGVAGGLGGFHLIGASLAAQKAGSTSRLVGLIAAGVVALTLLGGTAVLAYVPRLVLGGLLLFVGLDLLIEWVYRAWFRMPWLEYATIVAILGVIGVAGFLQGVLVGIALGILLFVIAYSRVSVVKHELSGVTYRSSVDRPPRQQHALRARGDQAYILLLQGFLFFGTATNLLDTIQRRVADPTRQPVRFIVLDCRLVTGIDSSAILTLTRLRQVAQDRAIVVVLTSLAPAVDCFLRKGGVADAQDPTFRVFPDLDRGVEWYEDHLLTAAPSLIGAPRPMIDQLADLLASRGAASAVMRYLERVQAPVGTCVIQQGAPSDALYLVESGRLAVVSERPDGGQVRLRTITAETVVGELGVFLGVPRTTSIVVEEPSSIYRLTTQAVRAMRRDDPALALAFHDLMTRLLAERFVSASETIAALIR